MYRIDINNWASGWRAAHWFGNANNGANAGLAYSNFNNSSGNANANAGSHLCYFTDVYSLPLGKKNKITSSVGICQLAENALHKEQSMKTYKNLINDVSNIDNIRAAYYAARKGKRNYREVKLIDADPEKYIKRLHELLLNDQFKNSDYVIFTRQTGGKLRTIYKLPFYPDRIVHHSIVQVLKPIWMKLLIRNTFSTIEGRGVHDGVSRFRKALQDREGTRYCLKIDISKYYPSIDHDVLKSILRRKIKDERLMKLLSMIIDSAPGIPIGNYISQWFGNIYLAYFDHFIKEKLGFRYYFRYADDIVILSESKELLHSAFKKISEYLNDKLKLQVKGNYQVFPVSVRGVDFLGYRFWHTHTLVRKSIVKRFKRKLKGSKTSPKVESAYWGWFKHADTHNLISKYYEGIKN